MRRRIPVIVIAGFLGAGKTTLLNHLLHDTGGARIGVVVNDFGAVNIDSMLVAGQVDSMVSLGNGCVCCAVDAEELDEMLDRLAQPRSPVDVIVLEASGLAEPVNLIRMVIGSANPHICYGGLVEVVDAAHFPEISARHPELSAQLRLADLVVLNKADLVADKQLSLLRRELARTVGQVPVHVTTRGRLDAGLLFDPPDRSKAVRGKPVAEQLTLDQLLREDHHSEPHLHDAYDSLTFTSAAPLHPRLLITLLEDPPDGLFRAKGFVRFAVAAEPRTFLLHLVGRHVMFEPWPSPASGSTTELVFIGAGMAADALQARLAATVHLDSEPLEFDTMLGIYRYVPAEPEQHRVDEEPARS